MYNHFIKQIKFYLQKLFTNAIYKGACAMSFADAMNYFYYRTSVNELRWMNADGEKLSYTSLLYLNIIAYTPDCTVSRLSELVRITKPAVTLKVNELTRRGYVVKERSVSDGRVVFLHLSPAMTELYGMYDRLGESTEEMLRRCYSERDIELFSNMLRDVAEHELPPAEAADQIL
jgi:DNA-binding MarR family transcriptional regulator